MGPKDTSLHYFWILLYCSPSLLKTCYVFHVEKLFNYLLNDKFAYLCHIGFFRGDIQLEIYPRYFYVDKSYFKPLILNGF